MRREDRTDILLHRTTNATTTLQENCLVHETNTKQLKSSADRRRCLHRLEGGFTAVAANYMYVILASPPLQLPTAAEAVDTGSAGRAGYAAEISDGMARSFVGSADHYSF